MRVAMRGGWRWLIVPGMALSGGAAAADFVVNNGGDVPFGFNCASGQPCTLREAVQQAAIGSGHRVLVAVAQCNLDSMLIIDGGQFAIVGALAAPSRLRMNVANARVLLVHNADITLRKLDLLGATIVGQGGVIAASPLLPSPPTTLRIHDSIISGGNAASGGQGGGIHARDTALLLDHVELSFNIAGGEGGGVFIDGGTLEVRHSRIERNESGIRGGGIHTANTPTTITNSLIAENTAAQDGGGAVISVNQMTLANSTFYGNIATGAGSGLSIRGSGTSGSINNVSFRHIANPTSAELAFLGGPSVTLRNSIVAGSCAGAAIAASGNLESPGNTCAFPAGNQNSVSELALALGPLASNGGATKTLLPQPGSAAINSAGANCEPSDQRDYLRNAGPCDVGAVEVGGALPDPIFADGFD